MYQDTTKKIIIKKLYLNQEMLSTKKDEEKNQCVIKNAVKIIKKQNVKEWLL